MEEVRNFRCLFRLSGFSLIETLVAMLILSLVIAVGFKFVGVFAKKGSESMRNSFAKKDLEQVVKVLEANVAVADTPSSSEPMFYGAREFSYYVDGAVNKVSCELENQKNTFNLLFKQDTGSPWILAKELSTCEFEYFNTLTHLTISPAVSDPIVGPVTSPVFNVVKMKASSQKNEMRPDILLRNVSVAMNVLPTPTPIPVIPDYPGGTFVSRP